MIDGLYFLGKIGTNHIKNNIDMWNYRVIRHKETINLSSNPMEKEDQSFYWYAIHEVYYDKDGNPTSITENPCDPYGEDLSELKENLEKMNAGLKKPILDYDFFIKSEDNNV